MGFPTHPLRSLAQVLPLRAQATLRGKGAAGHYANALTGVTGYDVVKEGWDITAPATDAAKQWDGWGTALKPAWEPIVVARKPLEGTVAQNVLTHGVGGINVDGCRVGIDDADPIHSAKWSITERTKYGSYADQEKIGEKVPMVNPAGRFPANVIHDGSDEVLAEFAKYGERTSGSGAVKKASAAGYAPNSLGKESRPVGTPMVSHADTGTAARFFYSSKAGRDDRWSLLTCDCETVKPETWVSRDQNQSALTDATSQPRDTFEADSMDECSSSMFTDGSEQTDLSRLGTASTTGTETNSTTGSETFRSAPTPNTSESTPDVNSEMESGGSRAADAESSNPSTKPNGTSQKKAGRSTGVAASATYARSLRTKNCAVCGAARIEGHPTQKPTSLMRYLVRLVTPKGGLVLDPFAGSGSTLIAAYREDCRAIGIELDPEYHKMAEHRIERATAQLRLDL